MYDVLHLFCVIFSYLKSIWSILFHFEFHGFRFWLGVWYAVSDLWLNLFYIYFITYISDKTSICTKLGGVTKQLKSELDYAKMIVNKQEDLTWLR